MGLGVQEKILTTVVALAAVFSWSASTAIAGCEPDRLDIRGPWGQAQFQVEIADDPAERAQGLMNRPSMPKTAGMLFVYDKPQPVTFWMKNTLISLDMIFADETGRVQAIHENAVPLDTTPIPGGESIQYVLEINGGMASVLGLTVGSEIRHPSIEQDIAAWPCDDG